MRNLHSLLMFCLVLAISQLARADSNSADIAAIHRWAEAKFAAHSEALPAEPNLILHLKPDAFARKNIQGHPFLIADQTFKEGIGMRSPGEIQIQVPSGASRFQAVVGVDSNDLGYYSNAGRGSVVASVFIGDKELYRSPVLHEGLQGIPLDLDLQGAKEFSIRLEAAGVRPPTYQPEWDQADWADARLVLSDGQTQPLSDLQIGPLLSQDSTQPPFSFQLRGKPSSAILPSWQVQREQHRLDDKRTEYRFNYFDTSNAISVRGVAVLYDDFPVVEWTLYFKNNSSSSSNIFDKIRPLDTEFECGSETAIAVHHSKGSMSTANDFQPLVDTLPVGSKQHFSSKGGRPTD
ncbi:MAG: NPCBM/NEW2 domain-containing protein, partial [Acidobacteriaceae bacterium]|nr:NPCBM/NEW2 domain-containing protein [Acidobacteriaceae bacterium]